jgi:two-component system LytT family response regulator
VFIRVNEIDWIEADDDLVRIHAGKAVHAHRSTLTHLEERLPASKFLRIHRSTLVNVDRIREIQPWFQGDWVLILADGTRLHSGKSYRSKVREYIERLT